MEIDFKFINICKANLPINTQLLEIKIQM